MKIISLIIFIVLFARQSPAELKLSTIKLPPGFEISAYIPDLPGARSMTWGAKGTLFVGTEDNGKVYAVTPEKKIFVLAEGLNEPNGVAFKNGDLYVAEINRVIKFEKIESHLKDHSPYKVVYDHYPPDKHHGWKFIAFGPDGKLYIPVGAPCNVCEIKDPYAAITRINSDGTGFEIFARGVRNTVGFDWSPITHELWFTDNGRDMMGDDMPSDKLNVAPKKGLHFGFPFCHQGDTPDPDFNKGKNCSDFVGPEQKMGDVLPGRVSWRRICVGARLLEPQYSHWLPLGVGEIVA